VPRRDAAALIQDYPLVARITVAGFEPSGWFFGWFTKRISTLSFGKCGSMFHGVGRVATALLADDQRLPARDRERIEVAAARHAVKGDCSSFTPDVAKRLYVTAVRLTVEHGDAFEVPKGSVGGCLTVITIKRDADLTQESIPSDNSVSPPFDFRPSCEKRFGGPVGP
jgi:hypothetical protein